MKKILQINAVYEEGSTGRTTKELNEYLQSRGYESRIAVSAGSQGEKTARYGSFCAAPVFFCFVEQR